MGEGVEFEYWNQYRELDYLTLRKTANQWGEFEYYDTGVSNIGYTSKSILRVRYSTLHTPANRHGKLLRIIIEYWIWIHIESWIQYWISAIIHYTSPQTAKSSVSIYEYGIRKKKTKAGIVYTRQHNRSTHQVQHSHYILMVQAKTRHGYYDLTIAAVIMTYYDLLLVCSLWPQTVTKWNSRIHPKSSASLTF